MATKRREVREDISLSHEKKRNYKNNIRDTTDSD